MHLLCDIPLSINGKTHGLLGSGPSFVTQPWIKKGYFNFERFSIILKLGFSIDTSNQQSLAG